MVPHPPRALLGLGLVLTATFASYAPGLAGRFVYDDHHFVVGNDAVKDLRLLPRYFHDPSTISGERWGPIYRPLRTVSYAADHAAWRLDPFGYHLTSLLLHLASVCAVFALARRLTGSHAAAVVAGAFLGLHPLPSEAVFWIGARSDILAAPLVLAAALLHVAPGRRTWPRAGGEFTLLAAAFLAKETAFAAVPALALLDFLRDRNPGRWGRTLTRAAPGAAAALGVAALRQAALGELGVGTFVPVTGPYGTALLSALRARAYEVGLAFRPWPLSGSHEGFPPVRELGDPTAALSLVVLMALVWLAWRVRRAAPVAAAGIGWYLLFLAPTTVVPLNILLGERWLHLPFAGIALAVGTGVAASRGAWERLPRAGRLGLVACGAGLALLAAGGTFRRAGAWATPEALWEGALRSDPENRAARIYLGWEHAKAGRSARAQECLEAHLDGPPTSAATAWKSATALRAVRGLPLALRIVERGIAEARMPGPVEDPFVLVVALATLYRDSGDLARAEPIFERALRDLDASGASVERRREGEVFYFPPPGYPRRGGAESRGPARALVWLERGKGRFPADLPGAAEAVRAALAEWPESEMARIAAARISEATGDLERALRVLGEGPSGAGETEDTYRVAADLAVAVGDLRRAGGALAAALSRWPYDPDLWARAAALSADSGDRREATRCLARARDLGSTSAALETLARRLRDAPERGR
ncbi:MAG: hypothetical protein L0216_08475 [Planctomycetales bacterium]|nr:hypothetical protein [Planctomycetales bacterium]